MGGGGGLWPPVCTPAAAGLICACEPCRVQIFSPRAEEKGFVWPQLCLYKYLAGSKGRFLLARVSGSRSLSLGSPLTSGRMVVVVAVEVYAQGI